MEEQRHRDLAQKISNKKMAVIAASSNDDLFNIGKFKVTNVTVKTSDDSKPPTELFIVAPLEQGTYPVLLFCHGFMLYNTWYSNLLQHIASHGYIVVAPKFYGFLSFIITPISPEIQIARDVLNWLSTGLPSVLPEKVNPDLNNIALSGHSRGGKTAFALALELRKPDQTFPQYKALIGIDPVAGMSISNRSSPKILAYIPRSLDMSIPVAVIGSGYGDQSLGLIPPFAPDGVNHSEFFNESKPPVCYFLAKDYGHCDMLDDWIVRWTKFICKSGNGSKDDMRRSVGGIVVAFLEAYLGGDDKDLNAIVDDAQSVVPITLDPVIYVKQ